eukprot:3864378-Prymnesium_polylepis.1
MPVSSVICSGGAATEMYACSTACRPPAAMPCTSRPPSATNGAASCEMPLYTKRASAYDDAPLMPSTEHSLSERFVPTWLLSEPIAIAPSASPTLNDATTHA